MLLLSSVLVANAQPVTITFLSLEVAATEVATGDEVLFSGTLTDIDGNGLAEKTVRIEEERATAPNVLATAVTDENGAFTATWTADLDNPAKDRLMSISAVFAGEGQYAAAKSGRVGLKVAIQSMKVSISLDKKFYYNGDSANFTIKFASPSGEPFDPDSIRAIYDDTTVSLARESEGLYKFKTPTLAPPKHTLQLIAEKHGYKIFTDAITFDVFARQGQVGVILDFGWSPEQVMQGVPTTFTLAFRDTNNIVTPFVNYDFVIKKGSEVVLELMGEQTTTGAATYNHTFADGGKYTVTVKVTSLGQEPDLKLITLTSDFNLEVIKSTAFAVKVKSLQKDNALRVTFRNPALAPSAVYAFSLTFDNASNVKFRVPAGWNLVTESGTIKIDTLNNPLEPGKQLALRAKVDGDIGSFDWSAMAQDGSILKSGTSKIRVIGFK
jgi:hypothetical protein